MDLAEAMRKEFSKTKLCWLLILLLQLLGAGVAVYAVFVASQKSLLAVGAISVLLPLVVFYLKSVAGVHYGLGEKVRRLLVIQDGLGLSPTPKDLLEVSADSTALPAVDPKPIGKYFDSNLPQGLKRVAHILEESSFYTRKQAAVAAWWCGALSILGMLGATGLLWLAVQTPTTAGSTGALGTGAQVAKVFSTLVVFFAAGTFATLWQAYRSLAEASKSVFEKCDALRQQDQPKELDVYSALSAYEVAVAKAPPLPGLIYWLCRTRLNRAWSQHMGSDALTNPGVRP